MKKKYYLVGIFILIIALIGYHYYAAGEAGRQIDEALQEQAKKSDGKFSVSYSAIDVFPFSGDIRFQDLNLTQSDYTQRASSVYFDLTYFDFLAIYAGGTEYGLKKINRLNATITNPSVVLRPKMHEFKSDTFTVDYGGNAFDLIRHFVTGQLIENNHQLEATAASFRYMQTNSETGFIADSIYIQTGLSPEATSVFADADHFLAKAVDITWMPPPSIKDKYGFFIRGFGYETGNIPVDSLLAMIGGESADSRSLNLDLHSELFHAQAVAEININRQEPDRTTLRNGVVNLLETSPRFDNFLQNAEQLFGLTIPRKADGVLKFQGPVTNLRISTGE